VLDPVRFAAQTGDRFGLRRKPDILKKARHFAFVPEAVIRSARANPLSKYFYRTH
jgi:hypothetical protein